MLIQLVRSLVFRVLAVALLACGFVFVVGCGSDEANDQESTVEVINLAPNAGLVTLYADDDIVAEDISYGELSAEKSVMSDESMRFRIYAQGTPVPMLDSFKKLSDDRNYLIIVYRKDSDVDSNVRPDELQAIFDDGSSDDLTGGEFRIRFGNFTRAKSKVDAYLNFSDDIGAPIPIEEDISLHEITPFQDIAEGLYSLRLTSANALNTLSSLDELELLSGKEYTVFLVEDEDRRGNYFTTIYQTDFLM